jgi:hypothetical protein
MAWTSEHLSSRQQMAQYFGIEAAAFREYPDGHTENISFGRIM